jgi:hypothetical protein
MINPSQPAASINQRRKKMTARFIKWGAIAAIAYPILQLTAQGLIQVGGREPAFTASAQEILEFFQNRDTTLFSIGGYLSALSCGFWAHYGASCALPREIPVGFQ